MAFGILTDDDLVRLQGVASDLDSIALLMSSGQFANHTRLADDMAIEVRKRELLMEDSDV